MYRPMKQMTFDDSSIPKIESNNLQKLIEASYKRNRKAEEIGKSVGFKLDHSLSNSNHKLFIDKNNNPYIKIPSNKEFVNNLKKYKEILSVRVDGKAQLGIKLLQLKG